MKDKFNLNKKLVLFVGFYFLAFLSLVLRFTLLHFKSQDYILDVEPWFEYLKLHGVGALKFNFSNYNLPYLYLLLIGTLLPLPKIVVIKGISIAFDLLLAYGVYLVVKHFRSNEYLPHVAALTTLFLPTVFINSAMWGQCDSTYTSLLLFAFYFLLRHRYAWMWVMWGLAFAFKLQAVFLLPLLLIAGMRFKLWKWSWTVLAIFIVFAIPAMLAGRSFSSILQIYTQQVGFYNALTLHAPNFYQWIPNSLFSYFHYFGIVLTMSLVVAIALLVYYYERFSDQALLLVATLIVLVVPFFLPEMHERYFYPAEIFTLLTAFIYRPAMWYAPVMQFVTLCAYTPFLFNAKPVLPLGIVAIFVLVMIAHLTYRLFMCDDIEKFVVATKRRGAKA